MQNVLNDLKNFNDGLQQKLARVPPPQVATDQRGMSVKKRTPSQSSRHSRESSVERKSTVANKKESSSEEKREAQQAEEVCLQNEVA